MLLEHCSQNRRSIGMRITLSCPLPLHMTAAAAVLLYALLLCLALPSLAGDTLSIGGKLNDSKDAKLVSTGGKFELGFFSPPENPDRYLGIWYGKDPQTVVWVANRDDPIKNSNGILQISQDGNLTLSDKQGRRYWYYKPEQVSSPANLTLKLWDSGDLTLKDDQLHATYWQSFQHPTDTFLPGMKMDEHLFLNSWRGPKDPGSGRFTFASGKTGVINYTIYVSPRQAYWEAETLQDISEDGPAFLQFITFTQGPHTYNNKPISQNPDLSFEYVRLVMNYTGKIELWQRSSTIVGGHWELMWQEPSTECKLYNHCGHFGSCNSNRSPPCVCLPGFTSPKYPECFRKTKLCRQNTITFIDLKNMTVGKPNKKVSAANETECRSKCLNGTGCPPCTAYSYDATNVYNRVFDFEQCSIWTSDLPTLQEESHPGINLSVLVNKRDIEPTPRTCKPCGVFTIPYPLSTDPSCGDPIYSGFKCDLPTGQLSFIMREQSYRVTYIDPGKRLFSIEIIGSGGCAKSDLGSQLNPPFNATQQCRDGEQGQTLEINWSPSPEPPCTNNSTDCKDWSHSTCNATRNGRCLCDKNYQWNGPNLGCTQSKEFPRRNRSEVLILAVTFSGLIFLACIVTSAYIWRRKGTFKQEEGQNRRTREGLRDSERDIKDFIDADRLEENDSEAIEVPYLDFNSILLATDNFSDAKKLGRGGYGPVYKGKLQGGEDIAVKRLSSVSSQGLKEFKNEVVLISKLQHRNLVRLRGYCITGKEKILLYEYMPNKSLDTFLFDSTQRVILDWPTRFDIIMGIARGMLYLHQDSRLRVIHRDLKTSNILLDEELHPKISDFGLAKLVKGKETEANTERIVGTYGYMAPEYALDGFFSIKSDVFSFGVVMLEIISGKKNTGFFQSKQTSSLLGYAWRLWTENNLLGLMDRSLIESCNANQFIKCAQVSLLCVQDEPGDRPTMSHVLIMLESETASLPTPKQPTFFMSSTRGLSNSASSSSKPEGILPTDTSYQEGR